MNNIETRKKRIYEILDHLNLLEKKDLSSISKRINFFSFLWYDYFQLNFKLNQNEINTFLNNKLTISNKNFSNYSEILIQKQVLVFLERSINENKKIDTTFIKNLHKFISISSIQSQESIKIEDLELGTYRKKNLDIREVSPYRDISKDLNKILPILNKNETILENTILFFKSFSKIMPFSKNNEKVIFCILNYYLIRNFYVPSFFLKKYIDKNHNFVKNIDFSSEEIELDFYSDLITSFEIYIEHLNPKIENLQFLYNESLNPLEKVKSKNYSKYNKKVLENSLENLIFPILSKMLNSIEELAYLFISFDKDFCLKYDNFLEKIPENFMKSTTWILEKSPILPRAQSIRVNYNFRSLKVEKKLESNLACTISILFDLNQFNIIFMSEGYNLCRLVSYYMQEITEKQIDTFCQKCKKQFYKIIRKLANF